MQTRRDVISQFAELRRRLGLTQQRLEELSGVPQQTISLLELGKTDARIDSLIALANSLHARIVLAPDEELSERQGERTIPASSALSEYLPSWTGVDSLIVPNEDVHA